MMWNLLFSFSRQQVHRFKFISSMIDLLLQKLIVSFIWNLFTKLLSPVGDMNCSIDIHRMLVIFLSFKSTILIASCVTLIPSNPFLQIISKKDLQSLPTDKALEHVQWEDEEQGGCKVTWQCSKDSAVTYYNVYSTSEGSKTLLGQSKLSCFYTDVKNKGHLSVQPVFYSTVVGKETTC